MRLTLHSGYALHVLTYVAIAPERKATVNEIAAAYQISHDHLAKVVYRLKKTGFLEAARGRGGGIRLSRSASQITIADIIQPQKRTWHLLNAWARPGPAGLQVSAAFANCSEKHWKPILKCLMQ